MAINIKEPQVLVEYTNDGVPGITECYSDASWKPYGSSISCRVHAREPFRGQSPSRQSTHTLGLHAQAACLAAIMGLVAGVAVAAPAARWRIADTSLAEFGQEVATDLF